MIIGTQLALQRCALISSPEERRMTVRNAIASVAVDDFARATAWYEKLLGAPASHPMANLSEWKFEGGGGLQVYHLPERAGSCSATLAVDDMNAELAKLRKLNVHTDPVTDNERVRVVMIKDPDGNSIAMAQALDPGLAH
jgi:predicted enzyme related to lactoylglutathione lyase